MRKALPISITWGGTALLVFASTLACESSPTVSSSGDGDSTSTTGDGGSGSSGDGDTGDSSGSGDGDETTGFDLPMTTSGDGDGDTDSGSGDGDTDTGGLVEGECDNGKLEVGEICDDGDPDGVGCSDDCTEVDSNYLCLEEGKPCIRVVTCGNGVIEGSEACDDGEGEGKTSDDDGCSADCSEVEEGWACVKPGEPCVELPVCGNGKRERGEQCDDAQDPPEPGDGCSVDCQLEDETGTVWECPPTGACSAVECGDGERARTEECDDGDKQDGDGCSSLCEVEDGFRCSASGCRAICGDGQILGDEECDDGDPDNFEAPKSLDGCSSSCRLEPNFDCTGEPSSCISTIICGNGVIDPGEVCDPGGRDGAPTVPAQADCYDWTSSKPCGGFDDIVPPPQCGNGVLEPGEACDGDGGTGACLNDCQQVAEGWECNAVDYCIEVPQCNDGKIQKGETCDTGPYSLAGCVDCQIVDGYFCVGAPSDCELPDCGNGIREGTEECDYDASITGTAVGGDGCSASCTLEEGWACPPSSPALPAACVPVCGDGRLRGKEQCDDGGTQDDDGCSAACQIERNDSTGTSYDCGEDGLGPCVTAVCGNYDPDADGDDVGGDDRPEHGEGCDDGNTIAGDGCGPTCQLEPEVTVGTNPKVTSTCGDGILVKTGTAGAHCSDGNPDNNDDCPEVCDDGNRTDGDGCSSECEKEEGWTCEETFFYPAASDFKITYRDFKDRGVTGGHPHMKYYGSFPNYGNDLGITGDVCTTANTDTCGRLDAEGKPTYVGSGTHVTIDQTGDDLSPAYHQEAFKLWYRDTNADSVNDALTESDGDAGTNTAIDMSPNPAPVPAGGDILTLDQLAGSTYRFSSQASTGNNSFYPLGSKEDPAIADRGFGRIVDNDGVTERNWHFTSELRYFFQYQGGEELNFLGDDDVWVFINGRLAVDIGGIHCSEWGRVVLGDEDSSCSAHGFDDDGGDCQSAGTLPVCDSYSQTEMDDPTDGRFGLEKGKLYEIVVFQAERSPKDSNYQLTLDGFIAPRSSCYTTCGDESAGGPETCDLGDNAIFNTADTDVNRDDEYGHCRTDCTFAYCGDGVDDDKKAQDDSDPEACDNGKNTDLYSSQKTFASVESSGECAPGCKLPSFCGDGVIDFAHGEECDEGEGGNTGEYGGCNSDCTLAAYCGDGETSSGEACDCGPGADSANCPNGEFESYSVNALGCGYDCQPSAYCGDDVRNGSENCDGSDVSGTRVCNDQCDYDAVCGDGIKNNDEQCDHGLNNASMGETPKYEGCTYDCMTGPTCGDAMVDMAAGEECDKGAELNTGGYDGCTDACVRGPHCGDAVHQPLADEECDNGFNEDVYAFEGVSDACGPECTSVPFCGDKEVQDAFEFCDDGSENNDTTYDGCTTKCEFGPYCGDGNVDSPVEACDDGKDNVAYSPDGQGCGYDCKPSPYCGDGVRNGPEQCDEGTENNDGSYGGCNDDCSRAPYCGDGKVDEDNGEQCDDGLNGSLTCTPKCKDREDVIR